MRSLKPDYLSSRPKVTTHWSLSVTRGNFTAKVQCMCVCMYVCVLKDK